MDFALIFHWFWDGFWPHFSCLFVPCPFAHSSCETLVFDDPYGTLACSGLSEKHDFSWFPSPFLVRFFAWLLMILGIVLDSFFWSSFMKFLVFSASMFASIFYRFFDKKWTNNGPRLSVGPPLFRGIEPWMDFLRSALARRPACTLQMYTLLHMLAPCLASALSRYRPGWDPTPRTPPQSTPDRKSVV